MMSRPICSWGVHSQCRLAKPSPALVRCDLACCARRTMCDAYPLLPYTELAN